MKIALRQGCKYALLVPTSMGLRITPENGQPVQASDVFHLQATSAETNVASVASYLGLSVKVLTTFVKGSPFAAFIKADLRRRGMDFEGPEVGQVVPHEVIGMANYTKNIFVGVGGSAGINRSHYLGATYGMERIMARYPIDRMCDGWNTMPDGEEIYYISNPALGLWASPDRFKD